METGLNAYALVILYKISCLMAGVAFTYMGYKLFLADKSTPAGDINLSAKEYALSLRGGAPGIFFSLFGAILICFAIYKGASLKHTTGSSSTDSASAGVHGGFNKVEVKSILPNDNGNELEIVLAPIQDQGKSKDIPEIGIGVLYPPHLQKSDHVETPDGNKSIDSEYETFEVAAAAADSP